MKKIIMFGISLFFVFSLSSVANAQPGGLLDGKPFVFQGVNTFFLTDGDPNTSVFITPSTGGATYTSSISMDISAIYYDWGPGNSYLASYSFYDSSGTRLYVDTTNSRYQQKVFLPTVIKNVTKIVLSNSTYEHTREFDVWGVMNLERPLSLAAAPGIKQIELNFIAPSGATGYFVYLNGVKKDHFTGESYTIKDLTPGVSYKVQLSAEYNGVESPLTEAKTVIPFDDPVIPVLRAAPSWDQITLSWNEIPSVTKFNVVSDGKVIVSDINATTYQIKGLNPETEYVYFISFTDPYGRQLSSNEVKVNTLIKPLDTTPPSKPTNFTASMSQDYTAVNLRWSKSPEEDLDGYNLYVKLDGNYKLINQSLIKSLSESYKSVEGGKTYFFRLVALDTSGNESEPTETSIKVINKPVTDSEQENTPDHILVTWTETPEAVGYLIYLNNKQVGTASKDERSFKITKAMGYNPSALANITMVKAKFADGSTGGGNNTKPPSISNPDGWGVTGNEIWKNIILLVASLGIFILLGICIRIAPKVFRILRQSINWRG